MAKWRRWEENREVPSPEKDSPLRLLECWGDFQVGLSSDKRKYPIQQFKAFWAVTKRYAELTRSDPLIHRSLAAVSALPITVAATGI